MRNKSHLVALVAALAVAAAAALVAAGAATSWPFSTSKPITLKIGQSIVVPAAAVTCRVEVEGGSPEFVCRHYPRPHHTVVFFRSSLLVYGSDPDDPVGFGSP